jgi:membrane protein DedA with SNARE-associated domain
MDINELIKDYGFYAIFFLTMWEGDITLLLAGVLAHHGAFGDYGFGQVFVVGTLGGMVGDSLAYGGGRGFEMSVRKFRFYRMAAPRIQRLVNKFGTLSIFIVKYIYGLRIASCVFYGVGRMRFARFLVLTFASCAAWVLVLSGAGYFFSGAITKFIGDFKDIGKYLLVIVVVGIVAFYLAERFWLSKKVEEANPEKLQELEHAAQETLHNIGQEIRETIHLPPLPRRKDSPKPNRHTSKSGETGGD